MSMSKVEAMEWAAEYAERNKLFEIPMKANGYPVDGLKPTTPEERARIIMRLAESVVDTPLSKSDISQVKRALQFLEEGKSIDPLTYDTNHVTAAKKCLEEIGGGVTSV